METADCESRGCSSRRVDEYPDVVHAILLRRPECALLKRVYDDVDFSLETPHNLPSSVRVVPAFDPRAARNAPARGQSRRPTFSRECIDRNRADGGRALAAQRNSYTRKLPRSSAFVAGFVITGA